MTKAAIFQVRVGRTYRIGYTRNVEALREVMEDPTMTGDDEQFDLLEEVTPGIAQTDLNAKLTYWREYQASTGKRVIK